MATASDSLSAPIAACAFGLDSSAISVAQQNTRSAAVAPADTKLGGVLISAEDSGERQGALSSVPLTRAESRGFSR